MDPMSTSTCGRPTPETTLRRKHRAILAVLTVLLLMLTAACGADGEAKPDDGTPDATAALFKTADSCSMCHDRLTDEAGLDYSFGTAWSGGVHSFAGIDPYYLATVSHEVHELPDQSAAIQETCATCHFPLANTSAKATGESTAFLDEGVTNADHPLHGLYRDGVTCLACHEIGPDGIGTAAANSGGFTIDMSVFPPDLRTLYGRYALTESMQKSMQSSIGYTAEQSGHMTGSEFCATCHTLYTQPVDVSGTALDVAFPEQVPYLEWEQSTHAASSTCQSCHMPSTAGDVKISTLSKTALGPVGLHTFTGGNTFLLSMVKSILGADEAEAIDTAIARTAEHLKMKAASLTVTGQVKPDVYLLDVQVRNLTGHKLPTAFPSRRVWLHVVARDEAGTVLFESGAWNDDGSIVGNDNDSDDTRYEPHYTKITTDDQVQIYEPILANNDGAVTTGIITATGYLKDNRLLPAGFDKATAHPDTAVAGAAADDKDFIGGGDAIAYEIPVNTEGGPATVTVELLYQSIGYRWLENLRPVDTPQAASLFKAADQTRNTPTVLARQQITIE